MDWIKDFVAKYGDDTEVNSLKKRKLHGYLQINFTDGMPINCNLHINRISVANRPISKGEGNG